YRGGHTDAQNIPAGNKLFEPTSLNGDGVAANLQAVDHVNAARARSGAVRIVCTFIRYRDIGARDYGAAFIGHNAGDATGSDLRLRLSLSTGRVRRLFRPWWSRRARRGSASAPREFRNRNRRG